VSGDQRGPKGVGVITFTRRLEGKGEKTMREKKYALTTAARVFESSKELSPGGSFGREGRKTRKGGRHMSTQCKRDKKNTGLPPSRGDKKGKKEGVNHEVGVCRKVGRNGKEGGTLGGKI